MKDRLKALFADSMWSIIGMVAMNMAAQFIVYPAWSRELGSDQYGDILYLLSLMNIYAISVGSSCNYARMRASAAGKTRNTPYLVIMGIATLLTLPFGGLVAAFSGVRFTAAGLASYILLICATMWRFYADVEYRLTLNYKGSFRYYLLISVGYMGGIALFYWTGMWPLALLPGEILGLAYVLWRGAVLRPDTAPNAAQTLPVLRLFLLLVGSEILSSLIFNGDRIVLRTLLGGAAVTVYYLASLLGKTISLVTTPMNSVIMGYLARYRGGLTVRLMNILALLTILAVPLLALCCTVASLVLIPILYPQEYAQVRGYFFAANAAQAAYFLTNIITVVLLRFSKARYPMIVNTEYAVLFCIICIPATFWWGVTGFCGGLLAVNMIRMLTALGLGYATAVRGTREGAGNEHR